MREMKSLVRTKQRQRSSEKVTDVVEPYNQEELHKIERLGNLPSFLELCPTFQ